MFRKHEKQTTTGHTPLPKTATTTRLVALASSAFYIVLSLGVRGTVRVVVSDIDIDSGITNALVTYLEIRTMYVCDVH